MEDFSVGKGLLRYPHFSGNLLDNGRDFRVRMRRPIALFVTIPTRAGLLSIAPDLDKLIRNRQLPIIRIRRRSAFPPLRPDIQSRKVAHGKRPHRVTKIDHYLVDLFRQTTLLQQDDHFAIEWST